VIFHDAAARIARAKSHSKSRHSGDSMNESRRAGLSRRLSPKRSGRAACRRGAAIRDCRLDNARSNGERVEIDGKLIVI